MRKRFYGDTMAAQTYTRYAEQLLLRVHNDMKPNNLQVLSRRLQLPNGVVMEASAMFGQDEVRIFAPPMVDALAAPKRRQERWLDFYIVYAGAVHKIDPATGLPVQSSVVETVPEHYPALSLAYSKKTSLLYALNSSIRGFNAEAGVVVYTRYGLEKQRVIPFDPDFVPALNDMHMSDDGTRLVAYDSYRVYVLDVETETVGHWDPPTHPEDGAGSVTAVAVAPDGKTVYVNVDYSRFEQPEGFRDGWPPETPYPSPDHHYTNLYVLDALTYEQTGMIRLGGSNKLNDLPQYYTNTAPSLAVSKDGAWLYAPVDSEALKVVSTTELAIASAVPHPIDTFTAEVAVAFRGEALLTATTYGTPRAVGAAVLKLPELQAEQTLPVTFRAFYDSMRLASVDGMHFCSTYESYIGGFGGVSKFAMYLSGEERYVHTVQGADTLRMFVSNVVAVENTREFDEPADNRGGSTPPHAYSPRSTI